MRKSIYVLVLAVVASTTNAQDLSSGTVTVATPSAISQTLATRFGHYVDVTDFGAKPNDLVDDTNAFKLAISYAASSGINTVIVPPGVYNFAAVSTAGILDPGVGPLTIIGTPGASILSFNEGTSTSTPVLSTLFYNADSGTKGNLTFEGLTFLGTFSATHSNQGGYAAKLDHYPSITFHRVAFKNLSSFATDLDFDGHVVWDDCQFIDISRDGARTRDSFDVQVVNSYFERLGDNAIAAHTAQYSTAGGYNPLGTPRREGLIVTGNIIRDSNGPISALGIRKALIANNIINRYTTFGIYVSTDTTSNEGTFPKYSIRVTNNQLFDALTTTGNAITVTGDTPRGGTDTSSVIPGTPAVTTGTFADPFNSFNNDSTTVPSTSIPFTSDVEVSDNTIARTLPLVTNFSNWGYGNPGSSTYGSDLAITSALQRPPGGITVSGGFRNSISNNRISSCLAGITITISDAVSPGTYNNRIAGNTIFDCTLRGIAVTSTTTRRMDLVIADNDLNIDPYRINSNSLANGSYTNVFTQPDAIDIGSSTGVVISGNKIQNASRVLVSTNPTRQIISNNVIAASPAVVGQNTSNRGVAQIYNAGAGYSYIIVDPDTTSSTYGQELFTQYPSASAMPSSGTWVAGAMVNNTSATIGGAMSSVVTGWLRLTTGSGNVANVDWAPLYSRTDSSMTSTGGATVTGHIASSGAAPTVSSCGTSSSVSGTDTKGVITTGTGGPTACSLIFASAFSSSPICVASTNTGSATPYVSAISTTGITISFSSALVSGKVYYHCIQ